MGCVWDYMFVINQMTSFYLLVKFLFEIEIYALADDRISISIDPIVHTN